MMSNSQQAQEETSRFVEDYRHYPELWDVNLKAYRDKSVRMDRLKSLGMKHGLNVAGVKNKIKNLRTYFRKEHAKVEKKKSYESPWFAYKQLSFLADLISSNSNQVIIQELDETSVELDEEKDMSSREDNQDEDAGMKKIKWKDAGIEDLIEDDAGTNKLKREDAALMDSSQQECIRNKPTSKTNLIRNGGDSFRKEVSNLMPVTYHRHVRKLTRSRKDEIDIFGELVTAKVRKLNPRNRAIAQNRINNILFSLEMEELNGDSSTGFTHQEDSLSHADIAYSPTPPSHDSYSND